MKNLMENLYEPGDILAVDAPWCNETFYFLIEGERSLVDGVIGEMYPYHCLNNGTRSWGKFDHPSTRKIA